MIKSGKGVWVEDTKGRRYLDGCSGAVVANIGHGVSEVNDAIARQLSQVAFAHTSQFISEAGLQMADALIKIAPPGFESGKAYFVCGGSEAVETSLKLARTYFYERGELTRTVFISRWNSYHGSTFGAMSVTGHPARRKPYFSMLNDAVHVNPAYPYRCLCQAQGVCQSEACAIARADELESAIQKIGPENVAAFIAEPVVGAALGAAVPHDSYWTRIREICNRHGVLLIADEVMTGVGRLGANFGLDLFKVSPDIIACGKGLAAGYMPLGAVLASSKVVEAILAGTGVFEHGFTYSGHPVACAAGVAVLDFVKKNNLIQSVAKRESEFFAHLNKLKSKHQSIGDVRGRGFMGGIEFVKNQRTKEPFAVAEKFSQKVAAQALAKELLVYPGSGFVDGLIGDHVIVSPPFNITTEEMETLFERLDAAISSVEAEVSASVR